MGKAKHETVEEILNKTGENQRKIVERLRNLVKDTVPRAVEIVRQKKITYTLNGRDFSGIRITRGHVDLLLCHGKSLSSPRLEGQGTIGDPKHIKVTTLKNFDEAETVRLLKEEEATVASLLAS